MTSSRTALTAWFYNNDKSDIELMAWLKLNAGNSNSEFVKEILIKVKEGKLVEPKDDLKRKKLEVDIRFKEICTAIKEKELLHWNTFSKTPSPQAMKAIKEAHNNQTTDYVSCLDEKNHKFICPECQMNFIFDSGFFEMPVAREQFADHYIQAHGEIPERILREVKSI